MPTDSKSPTLEQAIAVIVQHARKNSTIIKDLGLFMTVHERRLIRDAIEWQLIELRNKDCPDYLDHMTDDEHKRLLDDIQDLRNIKRRIKR